MTGRILLLIPSESYRTRDFMAAARRLGVQVVVGSDHRQVLEHAARDRLLTVDPDDVETSVERIQALHRERPFVAVVGVDDRMTVLAASAATALGLAHNRPDAVAKSQDKASTRDALAAAGLPGPAYTRWPLDADPSAVAAATRFPCVLKPTRLTASRGVIRADDAAGLVHAFARVKAIIEQAGTVREMLIEDYLPGHEVALEGLLDGGRLSVLALLDKPDAPSGPFFEETILITPSRLPLGWQRGCAEATQHAATALGLGHGPVHAELRVENGVATLLELAPRSIGGLCSRALAFGGRTLEEVILAQCLGRDPARGDGEAGGVMMIPIPRAGRLRAIHGLDEARQVAGVVDLVQAVAPGGQVTPPPEGGRYLGFIFARAATPALAEAALREAHRRLRIDID